MQSAHADGMPSDKLLRLFIIQAISSFVAGDQESGLHYLNEIKQTYAEHMQSLNPTLKSLAKEIIQSLDLFAPGASAIELLQTNPDPQPTKPITQSQPISQPAAQSTVVDENPTSVTSELQNLLKRRRSKKK